MAKDLSVYKFIQSSTSVPVCRVHVYKNVRTSDPRGYIAARIPKHWAGRERSNGGPGAFEAPHCIIGKEGIYRESKTKDGAHARGTSMDWEVLDARVNLTRQWQCSSAMIQIARPLNVFMRPEAPPIRPNDVIAIEMGYVKGLDTRVSLSDGRTDYSVFAGDCVFYGVVDSVKERGGTGDKEGVVVSIMARDMACFLVDNKVRGQYKPKVLTNYNRAFIVRDLIWRGAAIDTVKWQMTGDKKGYITENGMRVPEKITDKTSGEDLIQPADFSDANCFLTIGTLEKSERLSVVIPEEGNQFGIALMDKFPLDLIKHFSLIETAPRELWADARNGEINWMFRRTDMRKLINQPEARQYFYLYPPERANITSYTNEWSTAGTITHFTITNPLASSSNEKKTAEIYAESPTAILFDPHTREPLRPITRNRFVYDDTLVDNDGTNEIVAQALFSIWGRAIETGMVMVPGDPSLDIGEAVQLFNTGLFGRRYHEADPTTMDSIYDQDVSAENPNPEGIYRIEALTHLFAVGGIGNGYKTVFVYGPIDSNTGGPNVIRLVKSDSDWASVKKIDINEMKDNGNNADPDAPTAPGA